jgi:hypothetical protein
MDIDNQEESQVVEPFQELEEAPPVEAPEQAQDDESKGANSRIRELNQRAKQAEERAVSLEQRIAELTQSGDVQQYTPQVQPGEEITPERYSQDVTKTANSIVELRMKQYEAENRIKSESSDVIRTYPQLDPNSPEFDRELSDTITEAVEAHIRTNPYSAQVKKFTDRLMKPYKRAVEKEVGQVTEKIAKQVSETALRPTSVKKTEKTAGEMSIAELEKRLGVVNS